MTSGSRSRTGLRQRRRSCGLYGAAVSRHYRSRWCNGTVGGTVSVGFADEIAAQEATPIRVKRSAPTGFEPGIRYDPATGVPTEFTTPPVGQDVQHTPGAWDALVTSLGLDLPEGYEARLVEARFDPHAWTRATERDEDGKATPATTKPAWRYRFQIVPRSGVPVDLAETLATIRSTPRRRTRTRSDHSRVVVISDLQVGKVASGGGTQELIARVDEKLTALEEVMRAEPCDDVLIVDPGDLIENAFNVTAQAHTNDLSLPEQLRVARNLLTETVTRIAALHRNTRVCTVPSNHGQWRVAMGKSGGAGRPGDDFGLDVHVAVAEAFRLARRKDVTFIVPPVWEESLALEVRPGFVAGVVHGHQWGPGKAGEWWQRQTHGNGPTAAAHMLIHGHYHNASLQQSGSLDGRPRWVLQADAMDGGSDWFRNLAGERSEASVTTFTVGPDGRWDRYRRITGPAL